MEFRTRGVAETEIAVVAERAGVSRSAFYVHFADKDEVLLEFLLIEERRIAEAAAVAVPADATVAELFESVVATVLDAEERLGRRLVRDLCAAQFRPDFASRLTVDDHPLGLMLVEQIARRTSACDPVDPTMIFLTGLFGLLATDDGPDGDRRRRLGVLVAAASSSA